MDYFYSLTDAHGYVHSVDNLIFTYYLHNVGIKPIERLIEDLRSLSKKYPEVNYWDKLDINPCRKYSYYQNAIHLDDGIYVLLGHYTDYDKDKGEIYAYPMIRLEINPNKHASKPIFREFMTLVNRDCYDGVLSRYDYAIDLPVRIDDVQVFGSNKERGLYKGTRYFGQRNKNGFCRIYDKAKEQGLDSPMTRVEHVISCSKTTKSISFEQIYVKGDKVPVDGNKTDAVIINLCALCAANGLEYESILNGLDRRKRKTIMSQLAGCGYDLLAFDPVIHDKLIGYYRDYFGVKADAPEEFVTDADGYIHLSEDADVPFD